MDPVLGVERSVTTGEERNTFDMGGKKIGKILGFEIGWWRIVWTVISLYAAAFLIANYDHATVTAVNSPNDSNRKKVLLLCRKNWETNVFRLHQLFTKINSPHPYIENLLTRQCAAFLIWARLTLTRTK